VSLDSSLVLAGAAAALSGTTGVTGALVASLGSLLLLVGAAGGGVVAFSGDTSIDVAGTVTVVFTEGSALDGRKPRPWNDTTGTEGVAAVTGVWAATWGAALLVVLSLGTLGDDVVLILGIPPVPLPPRALALL
jgi:hypothetical protein